MSRKNKDYLIFTLCLQSFVCIIIFALLFILKNSNSSFFSKIQTEFSSKLAENISVDDVKDAVKSISDEVKSDSIEGNNTVVTDSTASETDRDKENLYAEIYSVGGDDIAVASKDEVPDNVSVSTYSLTKSMIMPVVGNITSKFGVRTHPISGDLRFHAGVDIAADKNTPIYSAFDGEIIVADYDQWNGNYLKISHDNDIMTVYCHCEKLNVKKGDYVNAGDIIGYVGSTGSSTGPHLHFELRIGNVSYDPQIALNTAKNAV